MGDITLDQFNRMIFELSSKYNTTRCHPENPFSIDGKCGKCPLDKPIFVLGNSACIQIPSKNDKIPNINLTNIDVD